MHGADGAATGPLAVGLSTARLGPSALAVHFIVTHALLTLIAWTVARRSPEEPTEHADFVPMMRTSASVLEIMPMSEPDAAYAPAPAPQSNAR